MIYIHDEPLSRIARRDTYILKRIGANRKLILELQAHRFINKHPARIRRKYRKKFDIEKSRFQGRCVYTWAPRDRKIEKTVLYLHGGAYVHNILRAHWHMIARLVEMTGIRFVVPDYPLAPEYHYSDAYEMIEEVYLHMLEEYGEVAAIMGDSAGGGLALGLAQKLRDQNERLPAQLILFSPWLDVTMSDPRSREVEGSDILLKISGLTQAGMEWTGGKDPMVPLVSPLFGEFTDLPLISFFSSTNDILVADAHRLRAILEKAELPFNYFEYPQMFHGWMAIVNMPEAQKVHEQTADLLSTV